MWWIGEAEESCIQIVAPVHFAEETRLNKFQPNSNRFGGNAIRNFSLLRAWSLLHEMHVVSQEGSSAYGKRTGHSGHTGLVPCSGPQHGHFNNVV